MRCIWGSVEMHEAMKAQVFFEPAVATCDVYPNLRIDCAELFEKL